jgi:hypothetical protein
VPQALHARIAAATALREVFGDHGLDLTELWKPFVEGVVEDVELAEKLEG